jgi:DNA-binding CsgD family transcriptional regulator
VAPGVTDAHAVLRGRERELDVCQQLLSDVGRHGGVVLLRGAAGVGKTALLEAARERALLLGFATLSAAGSEAETAFSFGALQSLLMPVIGVDTGLPSHLRTALLAAMGLLDAEIPALETVGLATLGLLSGIATEATPLCVLLDDIHWLDDSTAAVARFVWRRLSADPIVLIAAGRGGGWPAPGMVAELPVGPLGPAESESLLRSRAPELSPSDYGVILAEAEGNPLGIVELAAAFRSRSNRPRTSSAALPLTDRLEATFAGRVAPLPVPTRAMLLVAALAPAAITAEVVDAAAALIERPVELAALDPAVADGLVEIDGLHVRFRHPLIRHAVVQRAGPSVRRAAHLALAGRLEDAQRRLHHRAEASTDYDAELADDLEASAGAGVRAGSLTSGASALEQAALLTAPGAQRSGRLVRAAALSFELGNAAGAQRLLDRTDRSALLRADRATARQIELMMSNPDDGDTRPVKELIALAGEAVAAADEDGALRLLECASSLGNLREDGVAVGHEIVEVARRVSASSTDPRVTAILSQALSIEAHHEVSARLRAVDERALTDPESQRLIGFAAVGAAEYHLAARLLGRVAQQARRDARVALLATTITFQGIAAFGAGEWRLAGQLFDEAERLSRDVVQPAWLNIAQYMQAAVAGTGRDEGRYAELIAVVERYQIGPDAAQRRNHHQYVRGMAATMLGHFDEALTHFASIFDPDDSAFEVRTCFDSLFFLADAALAKHRPDVVTEAVIMLKATVPLPFPPALGAAVDYALAVTAGRREDAESRFAAALEGPARDREFDLARVQLAYGRWLRRDYRRLDAREQLRRARTTFDKLGNAPFAEQARDELRAAGEASPGPTNARWDELTPQELQIAKLVADGMTNKEIGETMFLSHRTIATHLYRIFPKLGVSSRTQLAAAMRQP